MRRDLVIKGLTNVDCGTADKVVIDYAIAHLERVDEKIMEVRSQSCDNCRYKTCPCRIQLSLTGMFSCNDWEESR